MKAYKRPLLLLLVATLFVSCSTDNMDDELNRYNDEIVIPEAKTIEIEILELLNNYRISQGLAPLNAMRIIKSQTFNHTDYMIERNEVSHDYFFQRKNFLTANAGARSEERRVGKECR